MFFEPPKGSEKCYGFVFYPPEQDYEIDFSKLYDGYHYQVVVVSDKTKEKVENFISEILEIDEFEIPLEIDVGSAIERKLDELHNLGKCSKHCRCEFNRERYWGHYIYHKILEKYFNLIRLEKNVTTDIHHDGEYREIQIIRHELSKITTEFIQNYEWGINEELAPTKGSLEFIIGTILNYPEKHFKLGNVNELGTHPIRNKTLFKYCIRNQCKYENGNPKKIWESKTVISIPDKGYTSNGLISHGLPTRIERNKSFIEYPKATIEKLNCVCSSDKNYCRLRKNEFLIKEDKIFKSKTIEIISENKDYRNYELTVDEQVQRLVSDFYEDVLPKKQAKAASKILQNKRLDNAERHSKFLLKSKLDDLERVVSYWPDLERLREKVKSRKPKKRKGGDNDE